MYLYFAYVYVCTISSVCVCVWERVYACIFVCAMYTWRPVVDIGCLSSIFFSHMAIIIILKRLYPEMLL